MTHSFQTHRSSDLVVACYLPLVTAQSLTGLVNRRDPKSPATAFLNREKNWPEPLLAIWEPAGLQILAANAEMNRYCPRKTLEQCQANLVPFPNSVIGRTSWRERVCQDQ